MIKKFEVSRVGNGGVIMRDEDGLIVSAYSDLSDLSKAITDELKDVFESDNYSSLTMTFGLKK